MSERPQPIVIAHRGSSHLRAEHTLAAYQQAVADGADGVECDIRLTADGVLVCVHDRRINRTSDGRGAVSAQTYAELSERDFHSWKVSDADETAAASGAEDDDTADEVVDSGGLLTLANLVEFVLDAGRPIDIAIETKHPVRFGGLVEDKAVELLSSYGLEKASPGRGRIRLMSFSEMALRRLRDRAPNIETVLLMDRVPVRARNGWLPSGARIAGPGIHVLREHPHYVERVHSAGRQVHVWVVDEPEDIDLCLEAGVDGIITNRPRDVLRRLGR